MKAARFEYRAASSVEEALQLLASAPEVTSVLAGGQSLVPMLNMRLARPELVVDLNKVGELSGIARSNGTIRIGAMTRQRTLELDPTVRDVPLLIAATRHIAHVPIRTRATVGGSLAHADPAAELPATASALRGRVGLRSPRGVRSIPAEEFVVGPLMTARAPDEILEWVDIPVPPPGCGWGFREVARTHGAFALVGVATTMQLNGDDKLESIRLALFGVGGGPHLPDWLDELIAGEEPSEALFVEIAERVRGSLSPAEDQHASSTYRRDVAATLTLRALREASERARKTTTSGLQA